MNGTISSVDDHGSIVIFWLGLEDGGKQPVYMDHRAFDWMIDGEGIESPDELIGRPVVYNGESFEFLANVEAA